VSLRVGTVMSLVNTAIGRVFAAYVSEDVLVGLLPQESIRLAGADPAEAIAPSKKNAGTLRAAYQSRLARIREEGIDHAFDAPVPGIGTLAAPVFDHTGSIRLVIALIGSSGDFDRSPQGENAQQLLAATRRLSWRFGWMSGR
jgi:DNA-binding IclR family transcriptional regulator